MQRHDTVEKLNPQLLKWIGNKQRFAPAIIEQFPANYGTYWEPFLGSGGVLATLAPKSGVGSDALNPLMGIWKQLSENVDVVIEWYTERYNHSIKTGRKKAYEEILERFNKSHNAPDFLFLSRACYGGVIRFRKEDGGMSTPVGAHKLMKPEKFAKNARLFAERTKHVDFRLIDYKEAFANAKPGDLIYCDPPYVDSQTIIYGAQSFELSELFQQIKEAKDRGVHVALSIDGKKKSGTHVCNIPIPEGLFEQELIIDVGGSMLNRFKLAGEIQSEDDVSDRLMLTYKLD